MEGLDFSFIRLKPTFNEAVKDVAIDSEYFYNNCIVLHPGETYLQISNSQTDIAFDDSYKVELIDCNENILADITDKVFINEFNDINGVKQIAFEIIPLNIDFYYKEVYFKFTHLDSDLVLYSNPVNITADNVKETIRLDYKSYSYKNGVSYDRAQFYQSIRVKGHYTGTTGTEEAKVYKQLNGVIRKSRVVQSFEYSYALEDLTDFAYLRLYNALNNDLVYINGVRAVSVDDLTSGERLGKTNTFEADFKAQLRPGELYADTSQIAPALAAIFLSPLGLYTVAATPIDGTAIFNYPLVSASGLALYNYSDDSLIADLSPLVSDDTVTFNLPAIGVGTYYIVGTFTDIFGQVLTISDKEVYKFRVSTGDFLNTDFNNIDFFTN